jgi:hypothetical protein
MQIDFDLAHRGKTASSLRFVRTALLSLATVMMFGSEAFAFRITMASRMKLSGSSSHSIDARFGKFSKQHLFRRVRSLTKLNAKEGPNDSDEGNSKPAKPFDKGASEFVPVDMQPANEWVMLKQNFLFDWPLLPKDVCISLDCSSNTCISPLFKPLMAAITGVLQAISRRIRLLFLCGQPSDCVDNVRQCGRSCPETLGIDLGIHGSGNSATPSPFTPRTFTPRPK